jgi:hypothetical protein
VLGFSALGSIDGHDQSIAAEHRLSLFQAVCGAAVERVLDEAVQGF